AKTLLHSFGSKPAQSALPAIVEVKGDVVTPGVYVLDGRRGTVGEAVGAAGGVKGDGTEGVRPEVFAERIQSGQALSISGGAGRTREVTVGLMDAAARLAMGLKLDLNRASERELSAVPLIKPE